MENSKFLENLKFGIGDGNLQYYVFNWKCPSIPPHKVSRFVQNFKMLTEFNFQLLFFRLVLFYNSWLNYK